MNVIRTAGLTKRYRRETALDGLDFTLTTGTACGLLGRNGAGKSTALRLMTGLLPADAGEAELLGKPVSRLGEAERAQLGYVSESQQIPGWMTVDRLLWYLRPFYPTWDEAFCQKLLRLFDLPRDRPVRDFSRGMRMKAAFLAALSFRPRVLVLDEPFSGLDHLVREELIDALLEITAQEEWTVLLASHDIEEVERLTDEIAWLDAGKLELRESIVSLQERFRGVSCTLPEDVPLPDPLPPDWHAVRRQGRRLTLTDARFDAARFAHLLPAATELEAEALPLKTLWVALLRGPGVVRVIE